MRTSPLLLTLALLAAVGCSSPGEVLQDFDGDGSLDADDCGPDDDTIHPGADDLHGDGIDQDCDGSDGVDLDGDGYPSLLSGGTDCVDTDPDLHPADTDQDGFSTCDGDCDDEDAALNLIDTDQDQFSSCTGDCDDANAQLNPNQQEVCDLLDNDCDGVQADDEVDVDLDGDPACSDCDDNNELLDALDLDSDSFSLCDGDCIDDPAQAGSELIYPAATDLVANGIDNNCDGIPGTDADGDLSASLASGGADCDDAEATTHPGATDSVGDAVDNNCDGIDGVDADGDTVASLASGGADCDDLVATTYPDASDSVPNGIDNNCDGIAGTDADGDLHASLASGGTDCDDAVATTHPGATDSVGDAVDNNCDGIDGVDADGDTVASLASGGADCDDLVATTYPDASDSVPNGIDNNCDGIAGTDADGDLSASLASGGDDCDDTEATTHPTATDTVGDGIDNNCDDADGVDADGDTVASLASGGTDCNDDPADVQASLTFPGAADVVADGIDSNCDGIAGTDDDGDLHASLSSGGDDCNDAEATIHPGATDSGGDGTDSNCDGSDGIDGDGDGYASVASGGEDCDDTSFPINPGAADNWGDGLDTNCDLADGLDLDGDSWAINAGGTSQDCNDDPAVGGSTVYPGAPDPWGDGIDQDCDIIDGEDTDGDGWAGNATGEWQDCNDLAASTYPGAPDNLGDGIDQDCDDCIDPDLSDSVVPGDGVDSDCDGYASNVGGTDQDCDDGDARVYPGSTEGWDSPREGNNYNCDGDLRTPLDTADARFVGENPGDVSGYSVSSAGDVDGDGLSDLLIGAHKNDEAGNNDGKSYLVFGSTVAAQLLADPTDDVFALADADASFLGENGYSGGSVASAGDVDGDGLDDLIIGAKDFYSYSLGRRLGKIYLFFGSTVGAQLLADPTDDVFALGDATFLGDPGDTSHSDRAGSSVSSAGDIDGDGLDDLIICAENNDDGGPNAGKTYLFFGSTVAGGGAFTLQDTNPDLDPADGIPDFAGTPDASIVGSKSISSAGDVDGDGLDDLLIGVRDHEAGGTYGGATFLFLGTTLAAGGSFDLSQADASFLGENGNDDSGSSVSSAGDVDGDGLSDLLIGAPYNDQGASMSNNAGKTYLFLGSTVAAQLLADPLDNEFGLGDADASFIGENERDKSGTSVSSAGDVDGDGLSDLLIGAPASDPPYNIEVGRTYLMLGSTVSRQLAADPTNNSFDLAQADARFVGENLDDQTGHSVASGGDVNGDGLSDLLPGAPGESSEPGENGGPAMGSLGNTFLLLSPFATPAFAGLWTVAPVTSYACGPGFASAQLDHLVINHVAPYATVAGMPELTMDSSSLQPGLLEGGFVTNATPDSFALTRTESLGAGACTATWSLTGSYTGPDTLSADFTATFTGSCGDCTNQSFPITATR